MAIIPTPDQIKTMMEKGPQGPMVMVNLLKYRATAAYGPEHKEAKENLSGREAYQRYGMVAMQQVMKRGGGVVWGGPEKFVMIGETEGNDWDDIVCVRYPSREAFLNMTQDPEYLAAHYHREAGLERTVLICCGAGMAT
ncbi:MAG TPA: DUF1330 domain-containing protein [Rhizomicrobium sp.]|nr:DUF1330 domain-containing protein [Rhizomicrobium sp.]